MLPYAEYSLLTSLRHLNCSTTALQRRQTLDLVMQIAFLAYRRFMPKLHSGRWDSVDIALVLDKIRPGAAWRMSDTYENLVATWEDTKQTLPTLAEIETAWLEMQKTYVPTLEELKTAKLQQIDTWTATAITAGFISSATGLAAKYDSDTTDQDNIKTMYLAAQSPDFPTHPVYQGKIPLRGIPSGQTEKMILQHTAVQMQKIVDDMALHIGTCKQKGWQLQDAVKAAKTAEELAAIK